MKRDSIMNRNRFPGTTTGTKKWILILPLLTFIFGWIQLGQSSGQSSGQDLTLPSPQMESTPDRVTLEVITRLDTVTAGGENAYAVVMTIDEGWHLNAHEPTQDYLIGVNLTVDPDDKMTVSQIRYPEPLEQSFEFAGDELLKVYEGETAILLNLETSETLSAGDHSFRGTIQIQACSDNVCLAPADVELTFPLSIGEASVASGHDTMFQELEQSHTVVTGEENEIAALFNDYGFFWMLIGLLFIGLALNLTPCVYPMMTVTISLFGGTSNTTPVSRRFLNALVYISGIVVMYSTLGAVAAYTGGLFGSWLQSPWVTGGIGVMMLLLALSMFGLYELQPPSWMMQKLGKTQQAAGHAGHFLSGLLVGVFAAPCIGPPIIALLAFVGSQGSPMFGFITFFVLALGLGLPYLFLATFSSWLGKMPQSGSWMIWVKKLFGLALVGLGLFYLSLVLLPGYTLHIMLGVFIASGIYLGFLERSGKSSALFRWVQPITGVVILIAALLLYQNLQRQSVEWEPFEEARLEQAIAAGEPVMMDFYADWCIPCIEMDRRTFTDSEVINRTERFTRLKVDLTSYNSEESEALRSQYDIAGVPTLLFLDSDGQEIPSTRVVGFMDAESFLNRVEAASEADALVSSGD